MAEHLDSYLATNGAVGHIWRGLPTLLLTTTGRRSGEERLLPLIYGRDGDRYVVVASRGGAPDHPGWYKNLVDDPEVQVQVGSDRFRARARTANRDERPRLWRLMTKIFPAYDQYQAITRREIPVILIERHCRSRMAAPLASPLCSAPRRADECCSPTFSSPLASRRRSAISCATAPAPSRAGATRR